MVHSVIRYYHISFPCVHIYAFLGADNDEALTTASDTNSSDSSSTSDSSSNTSSSDDEEVQSQEAENMKIDRSRLRKSSSEIPPECQTLIDRLCACSRTELLEELSKINTWTFGKCELYHWASVLDAFDEILEEAATPEEDNKWALYCDIHYSSRVSNLFGFAPL